MTPAHNEHPVQAPAANRAHEPFGVGVGPRRRHRVVTTWKATATKAARSPRLSFASPVPKAGTGPAARGRQASSGGCGPAGPPTALSGSWSPQDLDRAGPQLRPRPAHPAAAPAPVSAVNRSPARTRVAWATQNAGQDLANAAWSRVEPGSGQERPPASRWPRWPRPTGSPWTSGPRVGFSVASRNHPVAELSRGGRRPRVWPG
jgi:hypothetical protein